MFIFSCAGCGAGLTAPLSRVALPVHAPQRYGNGTRLPVLMAPGTFAVDPEPWGPPWRSWEEIRPGEAAARGLHAPVCRLSDGAPGAILIAPGDALGTVLVPERCGGTCCGIDGTDGPNMACGTCRLPVATRIDDCSLWQAVRLAPDAVTRAPAHPGDGDGDGTDAVPLSWAEALRREEGVPPVEPVTLWGGDHLWSWSPRWEAAVGRALAHLLAASEGRRVTVPQGLPEKVFQRALDALLPTSATGVTSATDATSPTGPTGPADPAGPRARRAVLAGPGLPDPDTDTGTGTGTGTKSGADILLVPTHPRTGEMWTPPGPAGGAYRVPLPFGVWLRMAFPEPRPPAPASGTLPDGVLRDDPPAPRAHRLFRADAGAFEDALVRLPAVHAPWLREILESVRRHEHLGLF
ncbi:hypothetical protein [Streptomyces sp. NPDC059247]|uniref:hypothetical protein n=1 Tax=Streptomyces sp. NPDC059247 TaxID=3346790 RepID=UPI0036CF551A